MDPLLQSRRARTGAWLVGTLMGLYYLFYVCPGLHWRDAGELTAAAHSLGIAHPTGFPLYLLVAKLASFIPFGSVAFRVNLVSAGSAAIAVGLCYRIVLRLAARQGWAEHGAAAAAALVLGSGTTLWMHATTAEIYALNLMATALVIWWVVQLHLDGAVSRIFGIAVLTGLGLGLHITFVMTAGLGWLFVLVWLWRQRSDSTPRTSMLRTVLWMVLLAILGGCVVFYIPLRAGQDPWVNWGNVTSLEAFWEHVSGGRIRQAYDAEIGAFGSWTSHCTLAMQQLAAQCSWGLILGVVGLFVLVRRLRWCAAFLFLLWLADVLFTTWINPMGMEDRQTGLTATICTVIALGVAGASIGRWMVGELREWGAGVAIFIAMVGLCSPAMLAEPDRRNLRHLYQAADLADGLFERLPTDALLLVTSDDLAGTSLYAQGVEGQRPDVTTVVKQHVLDTEYLAHVDRLGSGIHITDAHLTASPDGPNEALKQLTDANGDRAIFWELGDPLLDAAVRFQLRLDLPVAQFGEYKFRDYHEICVNIRRRWRRLSYGNLPVSSRHMLARMYSTLSLHGIQTAQRLMGQGKRRKARDWFLFSGNTASSSMDILDSDPMASGKTVCDRIASPAPQILTNYGVAMYQLIPWLDARDGPIFNARAERCFRRVAEMRPGEVRHWFNLGKARFRMGTEHYDSARAAFDEALLLDPSPNVVAQVEFFSAVMDANDAVVDANDGHLQQALRRLQTVIPELRGGQRREAIQISEQIRAQLDPSQGASETPPSSDNPAGRL